MFYHQDGGHEKEAASLHNGTQNTNSGDSEVLATEHTYPIPTSRASATPAAKQRGHKPSPDRVDQVDQLFSQERAEQQYHQQQLQQPSAATSQMHAYLRQLQQQQFQQQHQQFQPSAEATQMYSSMLSAESRMQQTQQQQQQPAQRAHSLAVGFANPLVASQVSMVINANAQKARSLVGMPTLGMPTLGMPTYSTQVK